MAKTHEGDIPVTEVRKSLMETKPGEEMRLFILYLMLIFVSSPIFGIEMALPPCFFLGSLFIIYNLLGNSYG